MSNTLTLTWKDVRNQFSGIRAGVLAGVATLLSLNGAQAQEAALPTSTSPSEQTAAPQVVLPQIEAGPTTIDPASLVAEPLARKATVEHSSASLAEVAQWIEDNSGVPVVFDRSALEAEGISLSEAVSDRLNDAPVYLMLNRLKALGLAWYVKDDVVRVTTIGTAANDHVTTPYLVGDLLDEGYTVDALAEVIQGSLGGIWEMLDGEGGNLEFLGDVLFVRQTHAMHLRLRGLLTALRSPARRTFIFDPPQHQQLRSRQATNVTVAFKDVPLVEAVGQLSALAEIDIRLDPPALREARIRERQPVTLNLADRPLRTVLEVLLADLELTTDIRDGVLWVTTPEAAVATMRSAVYDVRDLCRDQNESDALSGAMMSQTGGQWLDIEGEGGTLVFGKPGLLVVRQTDPMHQKVLRLLTAYRTALKASQPRGNAVDPEDEVLTRYYRVQATVALSLRDFLPRSVAHESWQSQEGKEPVGQLSAILSGGKAVVPAVARGKTAGVLPGIEAEWSVMVIRQTRATHREIARIIRRIEHGDERPLGPDSGSQGGLGGGGFGGGYFSVHSIAERVGSQIRHEED